MQVLFLTLLVFSISYSMPQGEFDDDIFDEPQTNDDEPKQCSDYTALGYYCVPYYTCNECNAIITDGSGLFDPRDASDSCKTSAEHEKAIVSECDKPLHVCCRHPNYDPPGPQGPEEGPSDLPPSVPCEDNGDINDAIFDDDDSCIFTPKQPATNKCGKRNIDGVDSFFEEPSFDEAKFGEWPHVCAILKSVSVGEENDKVQVYLCGASLIAPQVVLTSGHCVNDTDTLQDILFVRCGEWDTQTEDEKYPFQELKVNRIEKHPNLDVDNHHNNFALLFMSSAFEEMPHISPICLPQPGKKPLDGEYCVSHGWGKDEFGSGGKYQTRLKEVVVPVVNNDQCQEDLRSKTRLGEYYELDPSFICAGGKLGIDTCKGDGGSPLVCQKQQGTWYQSGIVSFGIGCGETGFPAVYADVAFAACWIDRQVSEFYGEPQGTSYFGYTKQDCPERLEEETDFGFEIDY